MKRILYFTVLWLYAVAYLQAQHIEVYNDTVCDTQDYGVLRTNIKSLLTSSYITESIPFNYDSDLSNATVVDPFGDFGQPIDDIYSDYPVDIGFTFMFFGQEYSQVVIGSNGNVVFEPSVAQAYDSWSIDPNELIPNITLPYYDGSTGISYGSIMGAYHDIDPRYGITGFTKIATELRGTAPNRKFIITYHQVPHFSSNCNTTHFTSQQIVLNESDYSIEVHIHEKPVCSSWNGGLATLGIQNDDASCGYYPGDNTSPSSVINRNTGVWEIDSLVNPEGWRFRPNADVDVVWFDANRDTVPGQTADSLIVSVDNNNGPYTCQITYYDCQGNATTEYAEGELVVVPTPIIDLGEERKRCEDESIMLDATPQNISVFSDPNALIYNWYKDGTDLGVHTPQYEVTAPGLYRVEVTYGGCTTSDEVLIENYANAMCKIPNVITPNDDSKNDSFILDYLNDKVGISKIQIFNRWGHVVYEKENGYTDQWHGQNQNGDDLPAASYYYVIQLNDGTNKTGWIYIIK